MKFDSPAGPNPADAGRVLGRPTPRIDGPLKVSGRAPYAYERHDVAPDPLVGYPVGAAIARGRIRSMDTEEAKQAPGVRAVITALDMEALPTSPMNVATLFGGAEVQHYHQAVAVVVAETFEQARDAAHLIRTDYEVDEAAEFDLAAAWERVKDAEIEPGATVGDFDAAFAAAAATLDRTYTTPPESHQMMEPHATIARWQGGRLTVWTSNQMIEWNRQALAATFGIDPDDVRVDSPYVGGGFGSKLFLRADAVLAALGARETGRAVKLMLPRPLLANNTTHRAGTIQRLRIGTDDAGRITAIEHVNASNTLPGGGGETATAPTRIFYAGENRRIVERPIELGLPESNAMRAPGEASGLMALEIAMDEMAEAIGMDPVRFRVFNDIQHDPEDPDTPFSQRRFVECLERGAQEFGWADRPSRPGSRREGEWLIGMGVAGGYRGAPVMASGARVRLRPDGTLRVETDMTDIGTGSYTIIAQTAAEMIGLPLEAVEVSLGDSAHPVSAGSGGQWGAASSTAGVYAACVKLREEIASRLGKPNEALGFSDGAVRVGAETTPLSEIAADGEIVAEDTVEFGGAVEEHVVGAFAAHFAEVGVNVFTGETRIRRMLAVCDAGRILNPITARSQVIGAMTMGAGAALSEALEVDPRRGFFANHDLAGYEVAVHADIPAQEVIFLEGEDALGSPLKAKGVGELGLCGVAAAIANAAHNATGIRVRDYPVTMDRMLDRLPPV